ncbi:MAG: hypothetical protein B7Z29_01800 [Hyphomicrobium sp. 12-62-95]|nr:MAG: hypothetical protein B7Z29_01800 [Hyphomicrobium sp. 12-62-95]
MLDQTFWNAFIAFLETRFGSIETVTAGYSAAKDALVERGLTAVQQQLATIVAELNSTVSAAQQNLLIQVNAAQEDADDAVATVVAAINQLNDINMQVAAVQAQLDDILESNSLPATGVTVAGISGLTATTVQAALAEIFDKLNDDHDAQGSLISALSEAATDLSDALAAHAADANPHGTTPESIGAVPATRQVATSGLAQGGGDLTETRTITVPKGTGADLRTATDDTKAVTSKALADAMAEVPLTDAATIAWDMATAFDLRVTLAGNRTLANPTNVVIGKKGRLRVIQDATGGRTLSFGSAYSFVGKAAPTLTTTANAVDWLFYDARASDDILISAAKNVGKP